MKTTDTTIIKVPRIGGFLSQNWVWECNDKNINGKIQKVIKSTKSGISSPETGATNIPPVGKTFVYLEASSNNHG